MVFPTVSSTKLFSLLGNVDVFSLNTISPLAALLQRNVLDSLQSSVMVVFPTVSSTKLFSVLGRVAGNVDVSLTRHVLHPVALEGGGVRVLLQQVPCLPVGWKGLFRKCVGSRPSGCKWFARPMIDEVQSNI